jgi:hypothetical protein
MNKKAVAHLKLYNIWRIYRYCNAFRSPKQVSMGPDNPLDDKFLQMVVIIVRNNG